MKKNITRKNTSVSKKKTFLVLRNLCQKIFLFVALEKIYPKKKKLRITNHQLDFY